MDRGWRVGGANAVGRVKVRHMGLFGGHEEV
jgi:hypothetical protein